MSLVLIVDDEAPNRELLRVLLTHEGHHVIDARDGHEALDRLAELRPDLTIVDLYMPGMGGTELIKRIRRSQGGASMKIALYTGSDAEGALLDFMQMMQVEHVIPKPAEPEAILSAIRGALA